MATSTEHDTKPTHGITFTKKGRQIVGHGSCPTCAQPVTKGGQGPAGWYHSNGQA
ncbi:MAG TPA: hypothetical protein VG815_14980 [Chloroflexota bacterium]|jgi:hypothetical protein|nr:hypothetical protein [Chloroflexota bacterium]HEV3370482.1 hypothetical protein [Acidimicrobiales bacterium]